MPVFSFIRYILLKLFGKLDNSSQIYKQTNPIKQCVSLKLGVMKKKKFYQDIKKSINII